MQRLQSSVSCTLWALLALRIWYKYKPSIPLLVLCEGGELLLNWLSLSHAGALTDWLLENIQRHLHSHIRMTLPMIFPQCCKELFICTWRKELKYKLNKTCSFVYITILNRPFHWQLVVHAFTCLSLLVTERGRLINGVSQGVLPGQVMKICRWIVSLPHDQPKLQLEMDCLMWPLWHEVR